jgi:hypothetical protein
MLLTSIIGVLSVVPQLSWTSTTGIRGGVAVTKSVGRAPLPRSGSGFQLLSLALFCEDANMADPTRKTTGDVLQLVPASVHMWNGTWAVPPPANISSDTGNLIYATSASMGSGGLINGTVAYSFAGSARAKPHLMEVAFAMVAGEAIVETEYYSRDGPLDVKVALLGPQVMYSIIFARGNGTAAGR